MAEQQGKRQGESRSQGESAAMAARSGEGGQSLARQYQDPLSLFESMFERMQRDLFGTSLFGALMPGRTGGGDEGLQRVPRVQIQDTRDAIVLKAELPGVEPADVKIEIDEDVLAIRGESHSQDTREGAQVERHMSFYRQIRLPENADPEQAEASYRNGVLTIRFPRQAERSGVRQIPIKTESGQPESQSAQPSQGRAA